MTVLLHILRFTRLGWLAALVAALLEHGNKLTLK